eukprot:481790-Prymnesium_polylepis.1
MGWPLDASRGLSQEQQVARSPQARCDRVLCRYCANTIPKASAVAERGRHRFDTRSPCRRALRGRRAAANSGSSER